MGDPARRRTAGLLVGSRRYRHPYFSTVSYTKWEYTWSVEFTESSRATEELCHTHPFLPAGGGPGPGFGSTCRLCDDSSYERGGGVWHRREGKGSGAARRRKNRDDE